MPTTQALTPRELRKIRLKIANPIPGGNSVISMYHAQRYVRRGDANFDEQGRLVFVVRSEQALISAEQTLLMRTCYGYDRGTAIGLASRLQMVGVPIVQTDIALGMGRNTGGARPLRAGIGAS